MHTTFRCTENSRDESSRQKSHLFYGSKNKKHVNNWSEAVLDWDVMNAFNFCSFSFKFEWKEIGMILESAVLWISNEKRTFLSKNIAIQLRSWKFCELPSQNALLISVHMYFMIRLSCLSTGLFQRQNVCMAN